MYAAYIESPQGGDIRIYSSSQMVEQDLVKHRIQSDLGKHEVLKMVKAISFHKRLLKDDDQIKETQSVFARNFANKCIAEFAYNEKDYYGSCRKHIYRDLRMCVYRILKDNTAMSLTAIGFMHNRDHSTVINGLRVFSELIDWDADLKATYNSCLQILDRLFTDKTESNERTDN